MKTGYGWFVSPALWSDRRKSLLLVSVHAALLLHVRYWKASLHLSPLSLLQAAFLCHYITYYGFQMSLQSHSGVGDGIGARRGCKVWTLAVTGSAAACDWDAFSGSLPTHCFYSPVLPASLTLTAELNVVFILLSVFIHVFILQLPNVLFPVNLVFQTRVSNLSPWIMRLHHIFKKS